MISRFLALILFTLTLPLYPFLFLAIKFTSPGPFIFRQKRVGKGKKIFVMYKFRSMVENAHRLKEQYKHLNELDGPFFKINKDPRLTWIGRIIVPLGIDELPQMINVIKGDMTLVGPRPFPIDEAAKIPNKYALRYSVLPGITGLWVIKGSHKLSFEKWMELDILYVKSKSFWLDITIVFRTLIILTNKALSL